MAVINNIIKISVVFVIFGKVQNTCASYTFECYGVTEKNSSLFLRLFKGEIVDAIKTYYPGYVETEFHMRFFVEPHIRGNYNNFTKFYIIPSIFTPKEYIHLVILGRLLKFKDSSDPQELLENFTKSLVSYSERSELNKNNNDLNAIFGFIMLFGFFVLFLLSRSLLFIKHNPLPCSPDHFKTRYDKFLQYHKRALDTYYKNVTVMDLTPELETKFYTSQIIFYYVLFNSYDDVIAVSPGAFLDIIISYQEEKKIRDAVWDATMSFIIYSEVIKNKLSYDPKQPNDNASHEVAGNALSREGGASFGRVYSRQSSRAKKKRRVGESDSRQDDAAGSNEKEISSDNEIQDGTASRFSRFTSREEFKEHRRRYMRDLMRTRRAEKKRRLNESQSHEDDADMSSNNKKQDGATSKVPRCYSNEESRDHRRRYMRDLMRRRRSEEKRRLNESRSRQDDAGASNDAGEHGDTGTGGGTAMEDA